MISARGVELDINGRGVVVDHMNTGVPHAVEFMDDVESVDIVGDGRAIRTHDAFAPAGANANFARVSGANSVILRTYERGVENETLACGTGRGGDGDTRRHARLRVRSRGRYGAQRRNSQNLFRGRRFRCARRLHGRGDQARLQGRDDGRGSAVKGLL